VKLGPPGQSFQTYRDLGFFDIGSQDEEVGLPAEGRPIKGHYKLAEESHASVFAATGNRPLPALVAFLSVNSLSRRATVRASYRKSFFGTSYPKS